MKLKQLLASALLVCSSGAWAQTDVTSTYITNAGFESCTARTNNLAAAASAAGDNYADAGWTLAQSSAWSSSAVVAYGGSGQVNGASAPAADNAGNGGNTLGVSVGWSGTNRYLSTNPVTLPAGHYVLTVHAYNALSGVNQFKSVNGFVPTSGPSYLSTKTSFTYATWVTDVITFDLAEATEGKFQIGGTAVSGGSGSNAKVFFDNLTLVYTDPLKASKDALQAEIDKAKLCDAKEGLADAISTAEGVLASATTTSELDNALATLQAADKDAVLRYENGLADATYAAPVVTGFVVNGTFDSNVNGWNRTGGFQNNAIASNQNGAFTVPFYENWNGSAKVNKMYQTISNIPNGTYRLDIAAFVNTLADPNESQYVFANSDKVYLTTGEPTAYEVYTVVTNNQIEIGLEQTTATANWMGIDNVSLRYYGAGDVITAAQNAAHKLAWEEAKAAAEDARDNVAYENVGGSERAALLAEIAKAEPSTAAGYDDAAAALNAAIATFTAAAPAYNTFATEIAYAQSLGVNTSEAEAALNAAEATATSVATATNTLKEAEYWGVYGAYSNNVSSMIGEWPTGNYGTTSGQGYAAGETYFDKWNGSAMDLTSTKTVNLPAGNYALLVAGRGVTTTTMSMSVKVGDAEPVSTPFLMIGDTGKGIDTNGDANYDEAGTYSNDNVGRGWQYRYLTFSTTGEEQDVVITISGHLNAGTWQSFYAPVLMCDDDTYAPIAIPAAKADLLTAIEAATAARKEANEGTDAFQYSVANGTALATAITDAQSVYDDPEATLMEVATAQVDVEAAQHTYETTLNNPVDGQIFNVVLTFGGWTYDQKAMTYIANGRNDMGNYNIQYKEAANPNLAQAFTFTKFTGNNYKMSQVDAAGNVRYLCTGTPYGGNDSQIRTTTNAEDALIVTVIPTATAGVWNLKNSFAKQYIGSQDEGVFTVNSHIDFNIVETSKPSIAINTTDAGWGTTILPFKVASLPSGVKAYSVSELSGDRLSLVEVTALEANKPYIIEGAWEENVTGNAQGTELTYKEGLLTGTYAKIAAPNGSYILQNQNEKVGFYLVNTAVAQPNVPANRAYLTVPDAGVKAFVLGEDTTTGINAVMNEIAAGNIYDMSGRKVAKMQKGQTYIVGDKKVTIK